MGEKLVHDGEDAAKEAQPQRAREAPPGSRIKPLKQADPSRIGPYRLLGRLGAGGFGRVYVARAESGRTVAVKAVHDEYSSDESFRARFRREIDAARSVGDDHTAPVLDADPDAEPPWVATGYVAGLSLEQVVRLSGPLPTASVFALADGMLRALKDIHAARIVHRDLKPSNVMLTEDGVRVIDFGIACAADTLAETPLTSTGLVVGSPGFMAPEQILDEGAKPRSDVFALGCVLAYAATGRLPFGHGKTNGHSISYSVVHDEPALDRVADETLRALISRCLTKDMSSRPDVEDLLADPDRPRPTAGEPYLPHPVSSLLSRRAAQLLDLEPKPEEPTPEPVDRPTPLLRAPAPAATTRPGGKEDDDPSHRRKRARLAALVVVPVIVVGGGTAMLLVPGVRDGGPEASAPNTSHARSTPQHESPATTPSPSPSKHGKGDKDNKGNKGERASVGQGGDGNDTAVSDPAAPARADGKEADEASGSGGSKDSEGSAGSGGGSSPSAVPSSFLGTWAVSGYGTGYGNDPQKLAVSRAAVGQNALRYLWDVPGAGHCEYTARLDSVGGNGARIHVTSGSVDPAHSGSTCYAVKASTFTVKGSTLTRVYDASNPQGVAYQRS
ncbi:protein kinase [Streptomyces sp. NPDC051684]|uniref:serine/threonine-protein kinase n=1 Tax=Streptomyces sp. NPDC051684 TaxID=3365670 RepID=UPI003792EDE6